MTNNGQTPDVFILISDRLIDAYSNKVVREIDYSQEDRDLYETSALNALSVANKVYAAPRSIESLVIYYNKDLLEYPYETLEEYAEYSEKIKSKEKYGLLGNFQKFYYANSFINAYGGYTFGKYKNKNINIFDIGLNNEGTILGLKELKDFSQRTMPKEALSKKADSVIDLMFTKGKAAAVINGPIALKKYSKSGINFGIAPLPKLKNGKKLNGYYGVKGYAISSKSRKHQLAEKFIRFINSPENAQNRYFTNAELPPIKTLLEQSFISCDELANTIISQINEASQMPNVHKMRIVWKTMDESLEKILSISNPNYKTVLNEAVSKIKQCD
ncbi:extracellular solute-binding protein, partial [Succinivibrio sp.]|uniref:extracellular solute-binding protein n=1 Tax=Succinivibrio sp. TaxID=2053619 RepID=UPI00386DEBAE